MVAEWKLKEVDNLSKKISDSKAVGVVGISGIPSKQFQLLRKKLKDKLDIYVGRKSVMKKSFEKAKLSEMANEVDGSTAILFSPLNPFQLNSLVEENKTFAPLKPGSKAPHDIIVPAGETGLRAGPILGELQKVGIKAQIKGGKIFVTENSLVAKQGDIISQELAAILPRLNIIPREISFNVKAIYNDGLIYKKDILKINKDYVISKINDAMRNAMNFAFNLNLYTKFTIKTFIQSSYMKALNLAVNAEIPTKETLPLFLQKAISEAKTLSSKFSFPTETEVKAEEKLKEEKKTEIQKEEEKQEAEKKDEKIKEEKPAEEKKEKPAEEVKKEKPKEEVKAEVAKEVKKEEKPEKVEEKVKKEEKTPTEVKKEEEVKTKVKKEKPKEEKSTAATEKPAKEKKLKKEKSAKKE